MTSAHLQRAAGAVKVAAADFLSAELIFIGQINSLLERACSTCFRPQNIEHTAVEADKAWQNTKCASSGLWCTQDFRTGGVEVPQAPSGVGVGRGYTPCWKGLGRKCPEKFSYFVENTIFWRFLTRLFLKSYANGRGSNPTLTPFSVCHCEQHCLYSVYT